MSRGRLLAIVVAGGLLLAGGLVGVVIATSGSSSDELVVYSARSHYGEEQPFRDFAARRGTDLTLFGGSASELYERIRSEGERTRADVLEAIADGRCDVGLTNSYYLGRELAEDPDFPVAPVWADQQGRGTHVNLSGIAVLRASDSREEATALLEYLTRPGPQGELAR